MKQGQVVVFLVKPDEVGALAQGHPLVIKPTAGTPFILMADPPVLPVMNGRPPAALMAQPIKPKKALRHPNRLYTCHLCMGKPRFPNQSAYMRHQIKAHRNGSVRNGLGRRKKRAAK